MQLKRIQHYLNAYGHYLQGQQAREQYLHLWEAQRHFQENWDPSAEDWAGMYDACLRNTTTNRLWKREAYEPKRMMLELIRMQPDMVKHAFFDLFNEEKSLGSRAARFVYYCDMLLQDYRDKHPRSVDNNHYHDDDYQMVSLYLAFRYPEQYVYYDAAAFYRLLELLGSTDLPKANDLERFAKVMQTLYRMMEKEEAIMARHRQRLQAGLHYTGESRLLMYDFYKTVTDPNAGIPPYVPPHGRS